MNVSLGFGQMKCGNVLHNRISNVLSHLVHCLLLSNFLGHYFKQTRTFLSIVEQHKTTTKQMNSLNSAKENQMFATALTL